MSLIAGCYERFLFGYSCGPSDTDDEITLTHTFTHAAHKGVVKALAAAGPFVASGGADDLIHIFDVRNDADLGFLVNPGEGAVTALQFVCAPGLYSPSHLLTASADGTISVWQAGGGWQCMKSMKGHRKEITAIAAHPSGKIALTTSRDGSLRMWDLVKGRAAFTTKLETEVEAVAWDQGGERYAMLSGNTVTLHGVEGGVVSRMEHPRRVLCMCFAPGLLPGALITGCEDGSLRVWDAAAGNELLSIQRAHATRIKAVAIVPQGTSNDGDAVASASSDGIIKLWDLRQAVAVKKPAKGKGGAVGDVECVSEVETRARITVMVGIDDKETMAAKLQQQAEEVAVQRKRKRSEKKTKEASPTQNKKQQQKKQQDKRAADSKSKKVGTPGHKPVEGVVSFIDDKDRERMKKKQRQVQINAERKEKLRKVKEQGKKKTK